MTVCGAAAADESAQNEPAVLPAANISNHPCTTKKQHHSSAFTILSPTPAGDKNDVFYDSDCDSVGQGSLLETTVSETADCCHRSPSQQLSSVTAAAVKAATNRQKESIQLDDDLKACSPTSLSSDNPFQNDRLTWQQNHPAKRPGSPPGRGRGRGGKYSNQHGGGDYRWGHYRNSILLFWFLNQGSV